MLSRNIWNVIGKIDSVSPKKNGTWISITGRAVNGNIFISDKQKIDVFIKKSILNSAPLKLHKGRELEVYGHLVFTKDECYLRVVKIG